MFPSGTRIQPVVGEAETAFLSGHFALGDASSPRRTVVETRIAYDARLRDILARKRHRQLSKDGHNLFVLDVTRVPEGRQIARPLLQRWLETQTRRVGAVVIFDDIEGQAIPLVNARARAPLPQGIVVTVVRGEGLIR